MSRPVRVLEVLARSAGGIARHVAQVVESLDGNDDLEVDVAAPSGLPVSLPKRPLALEIPNGFLGHRRARRTMRHLIESGSYDVVHAHGLRATIDAGVAAGATGARVIATIHNLVLPEVAGRVKAILQRPAEPVAVRSAERVLAVSEEIAAHLRTVAARDADRIEVLHLGIGEPPSPVKDRNEVRAQLDVPGDSALIVTVARLSAQKSLDVLLRAVAAMPNEPRLAILGEGPLEAELKALAAQLGIAQRVRFLGFRDDVVDHIAAGDVFALSSTWEGVPLAAQEAMALGVPVVSTDVGGMRELVVDGISGRLVPRNDHAALRAALSEVLASSELRESFAETALKDLHRNFSTAHMLIRLTQLYHANNDATG